MGKRQRTKHVPEEIIEEILLANLPVKSLVRFKSVSKLWRSIICTKTFTNTHLKKSSSHHSTNHHRLMICSVDYCRLNRTLSSSSLNFLLNDLNSKDYSPIPSFQHGDSDFKISIVGSCNGLILLAFKFPSDLILWNPSTRQVNNNIPPPPNGFEWSEYTFWYDDSTDDYKIVSIFMCHEKPLETHMYSLKTNSWKKIANFDDKGCDPINREPGKYLNGKLHWKAGCGYLSAIVSLDLAQGKYEIVPHPQQLLECSSYPYTLDVLGSRLCLVSKKDVWFMNKYGDPESWTCTRTFFDIGIPIWLAENGDVAVARCGSTVTIYDRRTNKSHKSRIYTVADDIDGHCIYVETLVSPFGHQDLGQRSVMDL